MRAKIRHEQATNNIIVFIEDPILYQKLRQHPGLIRERLYDDSKLHGSETLTWICVDLYFPAELEETIKEQITASQPSPTQSPQQLPAEPPR